MVGFGSGGRGGGDVDLVVTAEVLQPRRELRVDHGPVLARNHAVSRATSIARYSETRPAASAANVCGSSRVGLVDQPT